MERDAVTTALAANVEAFQLTLSRGAWLFSAIHDNRERFISTHTLTWSVTGGIGHVAIATGISTHTLTWSVTERLTDEHNTIQISTHTLTWSVTSMLIFWVIRLLAFQLTRSRGAWQIQCNDLNLINHFNSHAHVERDTWCCVYLVLAQRDADLFFYLMGIGLILFTVRSQIAWHFHANLLGICGSLGVRWSKY